MFSQHRQRRGWSQAHLAEQSGVSRTEISAIETGRLVPSVAVALKLASAMSESVETLFGGASASSSIPWAWAPPSAVDSRLWRATVGGRLLAYPVETTAAGTIPHDATTTAEGLEVLGTTARPDRTLVIAGCDPLVGFLVQDLAERHGIRVVPLVRSSTEALSLLRQGLVHVAGVHLTTPQGETANDQIVQSSLGAGHHLIHQMRWESGIAVVADREVRSVRALLRSDARWVNREEGSAARQTFDRLLGDMRRPRGYHQIVRDHRAVAEAIANGWADAGICIRPSATEARIGFVPLREEAYELCVADVSLDDPRLIALSATLRSKRYRQLVSEVPGCASAATGERRAVS